MAFINGSLLIGGLLIAIPIVIHLSMRRQPKPLIFPALRFVQQRRLTNQRRLQWRQWLLLFLRCLAVALLAFAFGTAQFVLRFGGQLDRCRRVGASTVSGGARSLDCLAPGTRPFDGRVADRSQRRACHALRLLLRVGAPQTTASDAGRPGSARGCGAGLRYVTAHAVPSIQSNTH